MGGAPPGFYLGYLRGRSSPPPPHPKFRVNPLLWLPIASYYAYIAKRRLTSRNGVISTQLNIGYPRCEHYTILCRYPVFGHPRGSSVVTFSSPSDLSCGRPGYLRAREANARGRGRLLLARTYYAVPRDNPEEQEAVFSFTPLVNFPQNVFTDKYLIFGSLKTAWHKPA